MKHVTPSIEATVRIRSFRELKQLEHNFNTPHAFAILIRQCDKKKKQKRQTLCFGFQQHGRKLDLILSFEFYDYLYITIIFCVKNLR